MLILENPQQSNLERVEFEEQTPENYLKANMERYICVRIKKPQTVAKDNAEDALYAAHIAAE